MQNESLLVDFLHLMTWHKYSFGAYHRYNVKSGTWNGMEYGMECGMDPGRELTTCLINHVVYVFGTNG